MKQNPFPGPQPYRSTDRARFFSRDAVVKRLANQVLARSVTAVFGASGAGKSSLMQAGVIPALQESDRLRVVSIDAWPRDEAPLSWLVGAIFSDLDLGVPSESNSVMERLAEAFDLAVQHSDRSILVYLDQIERIFVAERNDDEMSALLDGLAWLIRPERQINVHIVLGIREDYVGRYHDWSRERPVLSAYSFHVRPLSVEEMVDAMCQTAKAGEPAQSWNVDEIRELMLDVRVPGQRKTDKADVQTAFAQVVCRALWEERHTGQTIVTSGPAARIVGSKRVNAEAILHRYLDATLEEMGPLHKAARTLLEEHFINNEGHRRLLTDEEARSLLPNDEVASVLTYLEKAAILRAEEHQGRRYFELGHDWLANKLLERRTERARLRRIAKIALLAKAALVSVTVIVIFFGLSLRRALRAEDAAQLSLRRASRAEDAAHLAAARELVASGEPSLAALVLAAIPRSEHTVEWQKIATDCIAKGIPRTILRHLGRVNSAAWSPDGRRIVTTSDDKTTRIWSANGAEFNKFTGPDSVATVAAWSPNGQQILIGYENGMAQIRNADDSRELIELKRSDGMGNAHDKDVLSAAWSPDGKRVATASRDRTARVWIAANGKPAQFNSKDVVFEIHTEWVDGISWHPSGDRIITASRDGYACIWNAEDGQLIPHSIRRWNDNGNPLPECSAHEKDTHHCMASKCLPHSDAVYSASWSPDGHQIVTTSHDTNIRIWDVNWKIGTLRRTLTGHDAIVWSAAWSPDGNFILSASNDRTLRIWYANGAAGDNTIDNHPLAVLKGRNAAMWSAAWSPDGKQIVTASEDSVAWTWQYDPLLGASTDIAELEKQLEHATTDCLTPEQRNAYLFEDMDEACVGYQVCEGLNQRRPQINALKICKKY